MKTIRLTLIVSTLGMLGGCVAVPVDPGYNYSAPGNYAPAPAYYGPPVYYGPSVSFEFFSGRRGFRHHHRR